jgi:hypothetical protein
MAVKNGGIRTDEGKMDLHALIYFSSVAAIMPLSRTITKGKTNYYVEKEYESVAREFSDSAPDNGFYSKTLGVESHGINMHR